MKLFVTAFAVAKGMTDCGLLNSAQNCPSHITAPHCESDQICVASGLPSDCSYSCSKRSACGEGAKMWRSALPSKDGGTEYVDYCAKKPLTSSYSCGIVEGQPTVSVTFLPIVKAYGVRDKREYEFYQKPFGLDEYEYGMFNEATEECRSLLNKSIDAEGYTTLEFALDGDNSAKDACKIQFSDTRDEDADSSTPYYHNFQFAIGYENFMLRTPFGAAIGQPGLHTNFQCTLKLSDNKIIGFGVGSARDVDLLGDTDEAEFTMEHCTDKECTEVLEDGENPSVVITPNDKIPAWRYFKVDTELKNKYTHIEQCKVHLFGKDDKPLNGMEAVTYIEDGCVSKGMQDHKDPPYVWISPEPRPNMETSDRFGVRVFDVTGALSWKVECKLNACDYGNTNQDVCGLRESCPISDRYDNIFGATNNRIRRSETTEKDNNVKSTMLYHPCYYIAKTGTESHGWTRQICEEEGKI